MYNLHQLAEVPFFLACSVRAQRPLLGRFFLWTDFGVGGRRLLVLSLLHDSLQAWALLNRWGFSEVSLGKLEYFYL